MQRLDLSRWIAAAWLFCACLAAQALTITDDRGVKVEFSRSPQRIVSLLPSLTETICELGQCRRIVGVDRYSNYPAYVRALPKLGGGIDPQVEAVVALKPDVVLMASSSRAVQQLEALGLKVLAIEPKDMAGAQKLFLQLGQLLEVPDAGRIWRNVDAAVTAAAQSLPASARSVRVYFEVSPGYAAGPSSFIGETLSRLGLQNVIAPQLGPFPMINPEYVVRANPDLILVSQLNSQGLSQRPGWGGIRAIREQRICLLTSDEADVLVRPGPRMAEAARLIAQCVMAKK
ncbi:MAG: ABC transporter substrate-binding protein [Comamonadaceae bacterium]|nr:MAG: ABC transporter substrate-binding protein [Comamonadaceae bacterium]